MKKKLLAIFCTTIFLVTFAGCAVTGSDSSLSEPNSNSSSTCTHSYDNACDADCNVCGDERTPSAHVYTADCDDSCNVCGDTRTATEHSYDNACDVDCNTCGNERMPSAHIYDDEYDATCNICGDERTVPEDPVNGGNWTGEVPLS